jgi:hypothetical protein
MNINLTTGARSAAIMFNENGSVIEATPNFVTEHLSSINVPVPPQATFTLVLSKLYQGMSPVIPDARCEFSYNWNFLTNMGSAELISINNAKVNIPLFPEGIAGMLGFMSDIATPQTFNINGQMVQISRVILNVMLSSGDRKGGIMFPTPQGMVIQTTPNFSNQGNKL